MPLPDIHARTHLPGGTDPLPEVAGTKLISASLNSPLRSRSLTGGAFTAMDFSTMYSNDASFSYMVASGTPKRAKYLSISETGLYMVQASTFTDDSTPFSSNDNPIIEILTWDGSFEDLLINVKSGAGWDDGQSPIYGEMFTADEYAHNQMLQTVWFNFDPDEFGVSVLGLGSGLRSANSVTKICGGSLVVTRIGDLMTSTTVT